MDRHCFRRRAAVPSRQGYGPESGAAIQTCTEHHLFTEQGPRCLGFGGMVGSTRIALALRLSQRRVVAIGPRAT